MDYLLITFESTHIAIKTEKILDGLDIETIPTPRQLSTSCGISIKGKVEDLEMIKERLGDDYNKMKQCYIVEVNEQVFNFKKV